MNRRSLPLWGFVLSIFLGGMTVVQAYVYFPAKGDRPLIRLTAGLMLLFDIASSILIAYSVYYYLIPEFGSFERFKAVTPQFSAECLIAALITFMSQAYFVHQLLIVKRSGKGSWVVIWLIVRPTSLSPHIITINQPILLLLQALFATLALISGIGCVTTMYIFDHGVLAFRNRAFTVFFALAKGFNALTDIIATAAMCMFLTNQKGGIERTNSLLGKVMVFVVQRGVLVTTIQVAVLVAFFGAPGNLGWLALHMNVTRLYANTFFAMLNGRAQLREKHSGTVITTLTSAHSRNRATDHRPENISLDQHFSHPSLHDSDTASGWVHEKGKTSSHGHNLPIITKTVVVSNI
ncbi:hypothetical protein DFP72DRAFT_919623 [Ephemerocybe angulata]|uniref:DUF6534 domain-containing protein n=1 Tax=Ephemerocybe angulata TaxID=980116 RepID=A0A8H6M0T3_9AGAR|nr:hypothetical protein DFP72DRAFT_919623 [Tulosesus angulatus]